MNDINLFKALAIHKFPDKNEWSLTSGRKRYLHADLIAVRSDGETWLITFADDDVDPGNSLCLAIGRQILMMEREWAVTCIGLQIADPSLDPPLIRYAIAVPYTDAWKTRVREIPERIRCLIHLNILLVSNEEVHWYLPGVPI